MSSRAQTGSFADQDQQKIQLITVRGIDTVEGASGAGLIPASHSQGGKQSKISESNPIVPYASVILHRSCYIKQTSKKNVSKNNRQQREISAPPLDDP